MQPLKRRCGFLGVVVAALLTSRTGCPFNVAFANEINAELDLGLGEDAGPALSCSQTHNGVTVRGSCKLRCSLAPWMLKGGMTLETTSCPTDTDYPKMCCPERLPLDIFDSDKLCAKWLFLREQGVHEEHPAKNVSLAKQKCREYATLTCNDVQNIFPVDPSAVNDYCNPDIKPLIYGGSDANRGQFPHMALLRYGDPNRTCSGSLISDEFILTAAHCVNNKVAGPVLRVMLGTVFRDDKDAQTFSIAEVFPHPDYDPSQGQYNDLALLRLNSSVRLTNELRPACLHTLEDEAVDKMEGWNATVAGWGITRPKDGQPSEKLQYVYLPFVGQAACEERYNVSRQSVLKHGVVDTQLCAGGAIDIDVGMGDSGGPLMVLSMEDPYCSFRVVGVTSTGAFRPGLGGFSVYTRVSAFAPWISSIVWPR